jgi:glycosyltransferase involved in cell wall biosynthesis
MPRISCLMPVYNCERFVGEAVDSVLSQTFRDFELIIVDDGSNDGTSKIVEAYKKRDSRVVVLHKPNGGIVSALNAGLRECKGDYVARMDADDICVSHRFAVQIEYLDQNLDCVCVGGSFIAIDEAGVQRGVFRYSRNTFTSFDVFPVRVALTCHPLAMLRRDTLLALDGYRKTFPHAEDLDLFLRIADLGRVHNPDESLLYYRSHSGSISRRNVELQETAAAYAELAALLAHRGFQDIVTANMDFETARRRIDQVFSPSITATFVRFRIWRRLFGINPTLASELRWGIVRSIFSVRSANLFSRDYWHLRVRMLGRLILNAIEKPREALKGFPRKVQARA